MKTVMSRTALVNKVDFRKFLINVSYQDVIEQTDKIVRGYTDSTGAGLIGEWVWIGDQSNTGTEDTNFMKLVFMVIRGDKLYTVRGLAPVDFVQHTEILRETEVG